MEETENIKKEATRKRMRMMLIYVGILFGAIFLYKIITSIIMKYSISNQSHIISVSTMIVGYAAWQPSLMAIGSLRAIRGVNVTTELAGMVETIYFIPGAFVKEGDVLVQLRAANEIGTLQSLEAQADLAKITYNRDKSQYAVHAVSKQTLDTDADNLKNLVAQVAAQAATVAKKTIRAPFTGRLGICNVNPGQYVNPGDAIATLQTLDPIYIDFYVPQQHLMKLQTGMTVITTTDTFPGQQFNGKITTINPAVEVSTRNIIVEATLNNPKYELTPGMFAYAEVITSQPEQRLTLPQTAVTFNPYGEIVYIIKQTGKDKKKRPILTANQIFIKTGEIRGDQVTVLEGIKAGDTVVTSGQLKLKNGSQVAINNTVMPTNNPSSALPNEY